jgi:anaerobic selenocysteine-containing dehydrogenase
MPRSAGPRHFGRHPAADTYLSQPGLGVVLAARALGEFGDDKKRFHIRSLFVMGSNIAVASPDMNRIEARLGSLDHLTVCDAFPNETTAFANVVLPVYQWAEEEGPATWLFSLLG